MAVPTYVFSTFAFLGFVLVCIPLPWHWQAMNSGTCLYMIWAAIGCLNMFINSIVWAHDAINYAPVWCDISTRLIACVGIGIPAASLCINRRLYYIAACTNVTQTKAQRRRGVYIDLAIALGIPLIQLVIQYTVQGHRFDILEEIGCFPTLFNSWLLVPLVTLWPIVIGLVSLSYCTRTIYHIYKRQVLFKELLSSHSDITAYRYIRLMCLAGIEALCTVPIATLLMAQDLTLLRPFGGWDKVHWRFSRVSQFPSIIWRAEPAMTTIIPVEITRWSPVVCAFVFFIFFGFADEARKHYRLAYTSVAKRLGYTTATSSTAVTSSTTDMRSKNFPHLLSTGKGTIPIDIRKETVSKRDSFGSFNLTIVDVGGTLNDYKAPIFTSTASSGSSSSPTTQYSRSSTYLASPTTPDGSEPPALTRPQPALDITNVTRRPAESSPIRPMRPDSLHLEVQDDAV